MSCDAEPHPVRLVDDGRDLFTCHLGRLRVLALHRPGAGRHDLEVAGAVADLLADGLAHLPRPVGLAVHRPEDPGARRGRGQDPAARQDPRALDQSELDGAAQDDRLAVVAADVADRRDPGPENRPGRVGEDELAQLARARVVAMERGGGPNPGLRSVSLETWAWASIRPGITVRPPRSRASAGGAPVAAPTRPMRPSAMVTLARSIGAPPRPSMRRAFQSVRDSLIGGDPGGPFTVGARSGLVAAGPPPLAPARLVPAPAPRPRTSGARSRRARPLDRSSSRTGPIRTRTSRWIGAPDRAEHPAQLALPALGERRAVPDAGRPGGGATSAPAAGSRSRSSARSGRSACARPSSSVDAGAQRARPARRSSGAPNATAYSRSTPKRGWSTRSAHAAVVREQDQALRVLVEPADRIEPRAVGHERGRDQVEDRRRRRGGRASSR